MSDDGNIPEHILNGLRAYVDLWRGHHDLTQREAALALEILATDVEADIEREAEPVADGGRVTPEQAWAHFCERGTILPGHADTIAQYRADQIRRGEDVTRVGGDE